MAMMVNAITDQKPFMKSERQVFVVSRVALCCVKVSRSTWLLLFNVGFGCGCHIRKNSIIFFVAELASLLSCARMLNAKELNILV